MLTHYLLQAIKSVRVLIVGDVMLDRYWSGKTDRVSPEAPVPIVKITGEEFRAGGAANVAVNISALGAQVTLLGHIGMDERGAELERLLEKAKVDCYFQKHENFVTTSKIRILSQDQQLLRLDFEEYLTEEKADSLFEKYEKALSTADVVVFSDYGKGSMRSVEKLLAKAKEKNIPVLIDPKAIDFSVYRGATLITPNLKEFEKVVGPCINEEELVKKGQKLLIAQQWDALLVTRGKQGMTLLRAHEPPLHLPTKAREVYDVSGAGDTVIAIMAAAIGAKLPYESAAILANLAAGIVVGKLGTATVNYEELITASMASSFFQRGVLTKSFCLELRLIAKAQKKRVVMTNGCFDLLHQGHLQYLAQAKELGDYLIVAVNSDDSVKKLKGDTRPIHILKDRMAMLSALHVVDWVVSFEEETPEKLYEMILPDVLVKGGDYEVHQVVGANAVLAAGGEVKILKFVPGYSSSKIIDKVQQKNSAQ